MFALRGKKSLFPRLYKNIRNQNPCDEAFNVLVNNAAAGWMPADMKILHQAISLRFKLFKMKRCPLTTKIPCLSFYKVGFSVSGGYQIISRHFLKSVLLLSTLHFLPNFLSTRPSSAIPHRFLSPRSFCSHCPSKNWSPYCL